jgi:DNA-binding winged helix-turn-helix (wHTH) protein/tetratricopeptide (TPR) repeat protein
LKSGKQFLFPPFRLDPVIERLWRGEEEVAVRPKAFRVLQYLIERAGRLVTKDELLNAVWGDAAVTDAVLKVCIGEIREALGDDSSAPHFIETAHRRGYRFICPVEEDNDRKTEIRSAPFLSMILTESSRAVGREDEISQLEALLDRALRRQRQIVFITGEAGIGKTTLVEAFLNRISANGDFMIAPGQCLDQYGAGEAYLPVLEALSRVCRQPGREAVVDLLARHAPTWLAQMPALISVDEREELQREILGATTERMLREMAEALEALTVETPLVMVLEDLHWSDYSTLDLVSYLARRREPARLMLIGTYRPVEVILNNHPLRGVKQELLLHRQCVELPLGFLTEESVAEYLKTRFSKVTLPGEERADALGVLARLIHQRTDGNALFVVNVLDYLVSHGAIRQTESEWELAVDLEEIKIAVPENIRQMIEKQFERLNPQEQMLLEAASVAGLDFSAIAVAAALEQDLIQTEVIAEGLARRNQFLRTAGIGEAPDGTVAARYTFIHPLYQSVFYQRIGAARRAQLHQRIGERGETSYGNRVLEISGELAMHFEQSRDYRRAIYYLRAAAENSMRRYANREAVGYLTRALDLIERLPEEERIGARMSALEQMGFVRRSMGDTAIAAEYFEKLVECAHREGRVVEESKALLFLTSALSWIDFKRCASAAERALSIVHSLEDGLFKSHSAGYAGYFNLLLRGWRDEDAAACLRVIEEARAAGEKCILGVHLSRYTYIQSLRSDYFAAARTAEEALPLALELGNVFDYLLDQFYWAWALLHAGRWGEMLKVLTEGIEMAEKNGHRLWAGLFGLEMAWLREQVFDFEPAKELCEQGIELAMEAAHDYSLLMGRSLLSLARLGSGDYIAALASFNEIFAWIGREGVLMDWIWQMPLRIGFSQCLMATCQFDKAREQALVARRLAEGPGERTYLALACRAMAEISMAEGDAPRAEAEIGEAMKVLGEGDAPLAGWRVFATAAKVCEAQGRKSEAHERWAQSAEVIRRLAASLIESDKLRRSFLSHSSVREIIERAQTS